MKTQTIRAAIAAALTIAAALPTSALTGSSPHRIAKDVTTTLCGDANCDGQVDISDSIAILQHLGNKDKYQLSETGMANADVDGNAVVTANDARCIQMFVAGLLPDLGGNSSIGTPNADLGPVRLMMRDGSGHGGQDQDRMTAQPGETIDVDVYVDRTDMKLGGILLRLGGELPKGVDVYMDDNYAYAFDGNKEYFQVGNFFLCDTLKSGDPQEVDYTEALLQFQLRLPADLKSGEYRISPIDFCQLFSDGTSHIYDVTYSPLVLCVPEEGGGTSPDPDPDPPDPDPDPPVPYLDPTDAANPMKACADYAAYSGENTLTTGWWVVSGAVTNTARIAVSGDVHLILKDGAELAADAGIRITPGNSLTLWAQSDGDGMGALTAVGSTKFNAGIGGDETLSAGTVTINGGRVNASANQGAGIGGGGANNAEATAGTGGTVTIRGGTVSASSTFGSAIGGGSASAVGTNGGAGGTVSIRGGTVTVSVGSGYAQPIGHGYDTGILDSGSLSIADGMKVSAGANAGAASAAPPAGRVDACRSNRWAKVEVCSHEYVNNACRWCGAANPYALCGDANCDGQVDFSDSIAILQHLGNKDKYQLSETGMANADVDGEAGVTANDASCIQQFLCGLLPDLGGHSSIGTPHADLGEVRLSMVGSHGQDTVTARPGEHVDVDVYVNRTDMRLGGIFLRLGGELPKGVDVYMEDNYAYAFNGNKEYFQVGNFFLCDTLQYGDPQEVDSTQALLQFNLKLPADLHPGEYRISPIDFCQLFKDGTSHIYDVTYSPLVLCVLGEGGGTPDDLLLTYAVWAAANGTTGAWNATDASGVHNVFRYLFDKPSGTFENPPLLSISFDASGRAVIHTPPLNPSATGFDISILATDNLHGTGATTYPLDADGETTIPASDKPARFFRLQAVEK